jgi:hypothetical protein
MNAYTHTYVLDARSHVYVCDLSLPSQIQNGTTEFHTNHDDVSANDAFEEAGSFNQPKVVCLIYCKALRIALESAAF